LSVAPVHAALIHGSKNNEIFLVDLDSVNGSYIDFNKVVPFKCTKLEDGMKFWFGYSSKKWTLRWHEGIEVRKK